MTPNTEPLNLKITKEQMAKLRRAQVIETNKQGKAISAQKIVVKLIDDMVMPLSPWQQMGSVLATLVESQPQDMTVDQFIEHDKKVRSLKRENFTHPYRTETRYRYPISINTFSEAD